MAQAASGPCLPASQVLLIRQLQSQTPDFEQTLFLPSTSLWVLAWLLSSGFFPGTTTDCQEKLRATAARLPLIIFSMCPCYSQILLGVRNPLSDKLLRSLWLCLCCGSAAHRPGRVLSSSTGSETSFDMPQENCFTILGFCLYIGLASNKGGERTLPT